MYYASWWEIIPELQGEFPDRMGNTRKSLVKLGKKMYDAKPEVIIVLTPHGTRINGQFSIVDSERMTGEVDEYGAVFEMERTVDRELASSIVEMASKENLSAASINYGTSAGPISCLQPDWWRFYH
jgi:aromatic ring-opening dioxygenase LigB subunit